MWPSARSDLGRLTLNLRTHDESEGILRSGEVSRHGRHRPGSLSKLAEALAILFYVLVFRRSSALLPVRREADFCC